MAHAVNRNGMNIGRQLRYKSHDSVANTVLHHWEYIDEYIESQTNTPRPIANPEWDLESDFQSAARTVCPPNKRQQSSNVSPI